MDVIPWIMGIIAALFSALVLALMNGIRGDIKDLKESVDEVKGSVGTVAVDAAGTRERLRAVESRIVLNERSISQAHARMDRVHVPSSRGGGHEGMGEI